MVWPILISRSVTPGAFSAAAAIAIAPLKSKQPNKIRNTARLLSPSIWPVALPGRNAARFDLGATCRWVRIRWARRTRPQSLGQECKSVATFQRFLIATARLAVDPERTRAVVNLRCRRRPRAGGVYSDVQQTAKARHAS